MIRSDKSYGVIPVCKEDNDWKVFLVNQRGRKGDIFWVFPRGHAEDGESIEETATRELYEETGLSATLETDKNFSTTYSFEHEGQMYEKTDTYFLGMVGDTNHEIDNSEVVEAGWFSLDDAKKKLTFDSVKGILDEVANILPTH